MSEEIVKMDRENPPRTPPPRTRKQIRDRQMALAGLSSSHLTTPDTSTDAFHRPSPPQVVKKRATEYFGDRFMPRIAPPNFSSIISSPPHSSPESVRAQGRSMYTRSLSKAVGIELGTVVDYSPIKKTTASVTLTAFLGEVRNTRSTDKRALPQRAFRILDVPDIVDDYYVDVLDWSVKGVVVIALRHKVYLWNEATDSVNAFFSVDASRYIVSVAFSADGCMLAAGDNFGECYLFDTTTFLNVGEPFLTFVPDLHSNLTCLAWNAINTLAVGTENGSILLFSNISTITKRISSSRVWRRHHTTRIVKIAWDSSSTTHHILASSDNNDAVIVWDVTLPSPKFVLTRHTSAIRALAFCPFQKNTLVTCGGANDATIRLFNTHTGKLLKSLELDAQCCNVVWSRNTKELLVCLAREKDQLVLFGFPELNEIATLPGHTSRPLYTAMSPDGLTVCTASSDENLKVFEEVKKRGGCGVGSLMR